MSNKAEVISIARNQEMEAMWQDREAELFAPIVEETAAPEVNPLDALSAEIAATPSFNPEGSKSRHNSNYPDRFERRSKAAERRTFLEKKANALLLTQVAELEQA